MSVSGTETLMGCEATLGGGGGKKKDSLGFAGSPAYLIIKDLGEIHSRLLDHWPVIQGETRYFVKEFEVKHGLWEMQVLENLKNMIHGTSEHTLLTCRETMQDNLNQVLQRLQAATDSVCRFHQREQEWKKIHNDLLMASEKQHVTQWEDFMKEQHSKQAEVDEEHRKAMEKLREQSSIQRWRRTWQDSQPSENLNHSNDKLMRKNWHPPHLKKQQQQQQQKLLPPNHLASASGLTIYSMALFCRKREPSPGVFAIS